MQCILPVSQRDALIFSVIMLELIYGMNRSIFYASFVNVWKRAAIYSRSSELQGSAEDAKRVARAYFRYDFNCVRVSEQSHSPDSGEFRCLGDINCPFVSLVSQRLTFVFVL